MTPITTLLVDDETETLAAYKRILTRFDQVVVVGAANDGETALRLIERLEPQVMLLDLQMPFASGLDVLSQLGQIGVGTRAVVLTAFGDRGRIVSALRAGAAGYLLKSASAEQIVRAIENAAADDFPLSPDVVRVLATRHTAADSRVNLTAREHDVLELLLEGYTNRQMANSLFIEESTVKQYVSTLAAKLDVKSRSQIVVEALKRGIAKLD